MTFSAPTAAQAAQAPGPATPQIERDRGTDAALVQACLAGERDAFDRLYRRHVDRVHRRLARMIGRSEELEDLVQQVFLEAFRSLGNFRGEAAFPTWLYRITANVALRALRTRRRKGAAPAATDDWEADVAASGATPEDQARERELYQLVLTQVNALKPKQRIAFVLRHVEALSFAEIGEIVGAEEPTVRQRVRAAERKLVERLARAEKRTHRRLEANRAK